MELFAECDFSSVEYSCSSVRQLISLLVQSHGTKGILVLLCNEAIALLSQCSSNMNAMSNANEVHRIAELRCPHFANVHTDFLGLLSEPRPENHITCFPLNVRPRLFQKDVWRLP